MASVQHLPFNPTADTIELADGSRWVRDKTCHVVRRSNAGCFYDWLDLSCNECVLWPKKWATPPHCPRCGARIVDEEQDASEPI